MQKPMVRNGRKPSHPKPTFNTTPDSVGVVLSREDAVTLERQIIPLLNSIRRQLGKRPVIIPK